MHQPVPKPRCHPKSKPSIGLGAHARRVPRRCLVRGRPTRRGLFAAARAAPATCSSRVRKGRAIKHRHACRGAEVSLSPGTCGAGLLCSAPGGLGETGSHPAGTPRQETQKMLGLSVNGRGKKKPYRLLESRL